MSKVHAWRLPQTRICGKIDTQMARMMALDIGARRIGVAVSDETGTIAQPLVTIEREGIAKDVDRIAQLVAQHAVGQVVVGMPYTLRGERDVAARKVSDFVAHLRQALAVPVRTTDERLSTVEASRRMIEADVKRASRKQNIDAVAAALILERYLSQRPRRGRKRGHGD